MEIVVVVHLADEVGNPGAGGMWRWAVHVGRDFSDPGSCLNAGAEPGRWEALVRGQDVAVAAAKVAERCGVLTGVDTVELGHDPVSEPWPLEFMSDVEV
ncbi:MAG: hypothetical protein F2534_12870 [Actinobacteria bacterium]|nr:hypothetical protein [Actinomycetota bacterium]